MKKNINYNSIIIKNNNNDFVLKKNINNNTFDITKNMYFNYFKATSFSDLFSRRTSPGISNAPQRQVQQTPRVPQRQTQQTPSVPQRQTQQTPSVPQRQTQQTPRVPQQQTQQTPSVSQRQTQQTPSVPQRQTQQTPSVPQQQTQAAGTSRQFQGRTYDPNKMWSPQSNTGFRYEWNRGVFGISPNGTIIKEKLDGTSNHHADATVRISANLGFPIRSTNLPFAAAVESTNQGIILFQSEGDNAFVYFPNTVNESQLDVLTMELLPRKDFNFSFTHNQSIFENQTYQGIIDFANSIPKKEAAVAAVR